MTAYGDRRRAGAYANPSPDDQEEPVKTTSKARHTRHEIPTTPEPEPVPESEPAPDDGDDSDED